MLRSTESDLKRSGCPRHGFGRFRSRVCRGGAAYGSDRTRDFGKNSYRDLPPTLVRGEVLTCLRLFPVRKCLAQAGAQKKHFGLIGGGTPASCRRAAAYGEGWMPARITLATFAKRVEYLTELCRQAGKAMIETAVMPLTTIDRDSETSLRGVNLKVLLDDSYNFSTWVKPPSGKFSTLADIRGALLWGTVADIVRESCAYENAGANHIVYDLRLRFTDWYEQIELLGKEVLPALRA